MFILRTTSRRVNDRWFAEVTLCHYCCCTLYQVCVTCIGCVQECINDIAASEVMAYLLMLLQMLPHGRDSTLTCSIRRVLPVLAVFRWYRVWRPIRSVSMILLHLKWWPTYSCCCRCCHNVSTDFRQIFTWFAYYYASDADCCNCCGMVRVSAGHECELCGSGWTDRCAVCTRNRVLVGGLDHPGEKDTFESHTWGCPDLLWSILSVFFH